MLYRRGGRGIRLRDVVILLVSVVAVSLSAPQVFASPYSSAVLADSPVAYYRFEDGASTNGSTAVNSGSTGSAINGVYNGTGMTLVANTFNGGANGLGNAIDLANLSSVNYVRVPDHNDLDLTTSATLEAWINAPSASTAANTWARILDKARSTSYMLFLDATTGRPAEQNASHTLVDDQDVRGGGWTHVVATFDSNVGWKMYVNGVLSVSDTNKTVLQTNSNVLDLFKDPLSTIDRYTGQADEIAIYSTALSAEQVLTHYTAASQIATVPEPSTAVLMAASAASLGIAPFVRRLRVRSVRVRRRATAATRRSAL